MTEFRFVMHGIEQTRREFTAIERRTNRATMWAVREAGRTTAKVARRAAPVYRGATTGGKVQRKGALGPAGNPNAPVAGLLRASIRPARRLIRHGAGEFQLNVAPRGARVHLYSGKIEGRVRYMADGQRAASARMPEIAARAWERAIRR